MLSEGKLGVLPQGITFGCYLKVIMFVCLPRQGNVSLVCYLKITLVCYLKAMFVC